MIGVTELCLSGSCKSGKQINGVRGTIALQPVKKQWYLEVHGGFAQELLMVVGRKSLRIFAVDFLALKAPACSLLLGHTTSLLHGLQTPGPDCMHKPSSKPLLSPLTPPLLSHELGAAVVPLCTGRTCSLSQVPGSVQR